MRQWLSKLFSESSGVSMMRVMSFICCVAAVTIAIVGLNKVPIDYSGLALLCSSFLSAAMGGKILQKKLEVNGVKTETEVDTNSTK
jgi:hypothetical protein